MNRAFHLCRLYTVPLILLLFIGCSEEQATAEFPEAVVEAGHTEDDPHAGHAHAQAPAGESQEKLDWCIEHAVPESGCTVCDPSLIAHFKESGDWCAGHNLPESQCRLCNPGIVFPQEEILRARAIDLTDHEIGVTLNFRPNAEVCATDGALIQFASANTAERAGISVQAVRTSQRQLIEEAPAEIRFDETEMTALTISVPALVTRWLVSPGQEVKRGDILAILQSPEIARLKSALVSASAKYDLEQAELARYTQMNERNLVSKVDFDQQSAMTALARAEFVSARSQLLTAGMSEGDIAEMLKHESLSNQLLLRAPADGVVIERIAQLGNLLQAGETFATIGNPDALWIEASLTEQQMREIEIGQHLTFSSDGRAVNQVGGEIIWLSRFLDPHTRTGTVRARVIGVDHRLRAGEFGRVRITDIHHDMVSLIPRDAVQWEGCCNVVFVKESADRYRPRKVQIIDSDGPFYQVTDDLRLGEEVVVDGAFLLKTELKKSSIGAGCCGLEPVG